jgi:hypothetical protein
VTSGPYRAIRDPDGTPVQTMRRACLRCRCDFDSYGAGNRLCDPCRTLSADASPYAV